MNILPDLQKNNLNKGFKSRFVIVSAVVSSLGIFASSIMLVPGYLASRIEFEELISETKFAKNEISAETQEILNLPKEINSKIKTIKTNSSNKSAFFIISEALMNRPSGITVSSISSNSIKGGGRIVLSGITVSGIAKDRKSLIEFSKILEENTNFSKVDVPVNSFAKDTNLPFSINISLSK